MAIDPINWRREMKKFIGAELAALKNENSQLRAEVQALRNDISQIYATLNSIEELMRLLTANSIMTNLEDNVTREVENNVPTAIPAREKIPVFGMHKTNIKSFCEIAEKRNLPVDFVITDNVNYSSNFAVFIVNNLKVNDADKNFFENLYKKYTKILIIVDDSRNSKNSYVKGVFTKFKNSLPNYIDWSKISVLYVDLNAASNRGTSVLFELSNFPEVEKFFRSEKF